MASVRRSGRKRKESTRYATDVFEGLDIDVSSDDQEQSKKNGRGEVENSDDEFDIEDETGDGAQEEDEVSSAVEEGNSGSNASDVETISDLEVRPVKRPTQKSRATPRAPKETKSTPSKNRTPNTRKATARRRRPAEVHAKHEYHSRGVLEIIQKSGKHERRDYMFGAYEEDWRPVSIAMDKWLDDTVLPSRKADKNHVGGFAHSWFYPDSLREREASDGWSWYQENSRAEIIKQRQTSTNLSEKQASKYLPVSGSQPLRFILGPFGKQKLHSLDFTQSLNISSAYQTILEGSNGSENADAAPSKIPHGWFLNVGSRVQDTQWIPNQSGKTQYLSISLLGKDPSVDHNAGQWTTPAFATSPPYPASLQIWAFEGHEVDESGAAATPNYSIPPRLELVICTSWGGIKQFQWCPVPGRPKDGDTLKNLGLLAVVYGDGKLRVLNISYDPSPTTKQKTQYIHITSAAVELSIRSTILTSVTWLSSSTIAAGCANGNVAIWSLAAALDHYHHYKPTVSSSPPLPPKPFYYQPHHQTYILSLASGYPSRPYYLATASMDGYLRLTDIRSPTLDTLLSSRHRVGSLCVLWNDHLQAFLAPDETYCMRMYGVRKFYTTVILGKFMESNVACVALSPVHAIVLMGSTDGEVATTNPLRRVNDPKSPAIQQTWFVHEWRRPVKRPPPHPPHHNPNPRQRVDQTTSLLAQPLARILESFEAYHAPLENNQYADLPEGSSVQTIFEPETNITAVAWNPNLPYGGWAAAATGTGLVRVEDIAV